MLYSVFSTKCILYKKKQQKKTASLFNTSLFCTCWCIYTHEKKTVYYLIGFMLENNPEDLRDWSQGLVIMEVPRECLVETWKACWIPPRILHLRWGQVMSRFIYSVIWLDKWTLNEDEFSVYKFSTDMFLKGADWFKLISTMFLC